MSKRQFEKSERMRFKKETDGHMKDFVVISILALVLAVVAWRVFGNDENEQTISFSGTENEAKVSRLLQEIEGVGAAEVMIYQTEGGVQSVVVVCEGANDLQVVMNVREAVAAALGTEEKAVKIYLKKE